MNIILIGFKKCGKSSLGKFLSAKLNKKLIDVDRLVELKYSPNNCFSYFEIYEKEGEKKFREIESQVIASLKGVENAVVATGGGTLLDVSSIKTLKKIGQFFYLFTKPEILKKRIRKGRVPSFLLENFEHEYLIRDQIFQKNADHTFDISELSVEISATQILNKINGK